jgi:hypothetical protein
MLTLSACALLIHAAAYHIGPDVGHLRSFTPGLGIACPLGEAEVAAGAYLNSWGTPSAYVAVGYEPISIGPVRIGALAGLVTGYHGGVVRPMAGLQASVPLFTGRLRLQALPKPSKSTDVVFGFAYQVPF